MMKIFNSISNVIVHAKDTLFNSPEIELGKWQGTTKFSGEIIKEHINYIFQVPMPLSVAVLQRETQADQPWAEEHFQERVSGIPMNPGVSYMIWPYNNFKDGDEFLTSGRFSHTYMERFWPKNAGGGQHGDREYHNTPNHGIWYEYGDLADVVKQLKENPATRQAYLPIWHPEDTGAKHGQRVPCTIGYHFLIRGNCLHLNYYIRSCDFYRHFKNDIYLTIRLAQNIKEAIGLDISLGFLTMHIGSFHMFKNDTHLIKKGNY